MASIPNSFRSFWHAMTSYDRHASHDSPYRTGKHVPLSQSRHAPLTSVATTASESRTDVSTPYYGGDNRHLMTDTAYASSPGYPASPGTQSPYSPGMRSAALQRSNTNETIEPGTPGEIQLQAFQEGLPPPPPVSHSWARIDAWAEENYTELWDQMCEGVTTNDLNELEHDLDCSLPMEVRESLAIHDGQERGGRPTGIIFGCMLLDCEEIVQEWQNWRVVNEEYLTQPAVSRVQAPSKAFGASSSASSSKAAPQGNQNSTHWRQELLARQDSHPPNAIQRAYAHPAWIPLARDWGGNNIAVDLAPGPAGRWGQVIIFGRDYDRKYVIARSWSAFLATVADDLSSGKWFVDEETQELKLREFKSSRVEPGYLDILRWRMDQKYGRPGANRRVSRPASQKASQSPVDSPYNSPIAEVGEPRGRSMQRFSGASPVHSPGPNFGKPSLLARVTEEGTSTIPDKAPDSPDSHSNLVDVVTPRESSEDEKRAKKAFDDLVSPVTESGKENVPTSEKFMNGNAEKKATVEDVNEMKDIEI